jgi:N-methylhydantoinase B/oxoprolinase/acetone carboxylase alpha subunit
MNAIMATWKNGKIVPSEPVDWPEGSRLRVEPVADGDELVPGDDNWGDDPASIEAWTAAAQQIKPMIWEPGEREEFEAYREKVRQYTLEAVRRQMAEMPGGESS